MSSYILTFIAGFMLAIYMANYACETSVRRGLIAFDSAAYRCTKIDIQKIGGE